MINLSELIPALAKRCNADIEQTNKIVRELFELIEENVYNGKEIRIWGFGKFIKREYKQRKCYNPITDKIETIGASFVPVFKAGTKFRNKLNK